MKIHFFFFLGGGGGGSGWGVMVDVNGEVNLKIQNIFFFLGGGGGGLVGGSWWM